MTKRQFQATMRTMAKKAGDELFREGMELHGKMTADEKAVYDTRPQDAGIYSYRLAKIILCAVANSELITHQFAAECILPDIHKAKRIRRRNRA